MPDKWTAFYLSLLMPGLGQIAARSWWALPWMTAAMLAGVAIGSPSPDDALGATRLLPLTGVALIGLLSAEHAKRLLEVSAAKQSSCRAWRVTSQWRGSRGVDVLMTLELARSQSELWPVVADLPRFLTIDPFHDRIVLMRQPAAAGVDLVLSHNAFGWRFLRFGRITRWLEGSGYTFSDLSRGNRRGGFPHVFVVRLTPACDDGVGCQLTVRIRGRWTAQFLPPLVGRCWVQWVCREHARLLAKAL